MKTLPTLWRRAAAGAAALALAGLGLVGGIAPAQAAPGNLDPAEPTSLTIHKFDGTPGTAGNGTQIDTSGMGNPLAGVEFTVTPVTTKDSNAINLSTEAGWKLIEGATAASVTTTNGYAFGAPTKMVTGADGTISSALPQGLYLVTETGHGSNNIITDTDPFLVTLPLPQGNGAWLYNVHVYPKNVLNRTVPTKTVDSGSARKLGDNITWTITAPVPAIDNGRPKPYTQFEVHDALDSRLGAPTVVVKNATTNVDFAEGTDYTLEGTVAVKLTETGRSKIKAGDNVTVTITTAVNSIGTDGIIKNHASVITNGSTVETDPTTDPVSNWGRLTIDKYAAGDTSKKLEGAVFDIYDAATGGTAVGTITTDATGAAHVDLWVGDDTVTSRDYFVEEVKAPAGYILPTGAARIQTTVNVLATSQVALQITNTQATQPELPLTGAAGRVILTIVGVGLVAVAVGAAFMKRRRTRQV